MNESLNMKGTACFLLLYLFCLVRLSLAADSVDDIVRLVVNDREVYHDAERNYVLTQGRNFVGELGGPPVNATILEEVEGLDQILINGDRIIELKSNIALTAFGNLIVFGFVHLQIGKRLQTATLLRNMPFKVKTMAVVAQNSADFIHDNMLLVADEAGTLYGCYFHQIDLFQTTDAPPCNFVVMSDIDDEDGKDVRVKKLHERWKTLVVIQDMDDDLYLLRGEAMYNITSPYNLTREMVDIVTTDSQAYVLLTGNRLVACGDNEQGEIAHGKPATITELTPIDLSRYVNDHVSVRKLSAGRDHVMVLLSNDELLMFGSNEHDQLLRKSGSTYLPGKIEHTFPVGSVKKDIIAEEYGSILISDSSGIKQIRVWGSNQRDLFRTGKFLHPSPIRADNHLEILLENYDSYYSAHQAALLYRNGTRIAYWISPATTSLFDGAVAPHKENGIGFSISKNTRVIHGVRATFFLDDGKALAIGSNIYGRLGLGDYSLYKPKPAYVDLSSIPTKPGEQAIVTDIAADDYFTLFLLKDGRLAGAGSNEMYQFAQEGRSIFKQSPALISALETITIIKIAAGEGVVMALASDKTSLYMWGFPEDTPVLINLTTHGLASNDEVISMHCGDPAAWIVTRSGKILRVIHTPYISVEELGEPFTQIQEATGDIGEDEILVMKKWDGNFYATGLNFLYFEGEETLSHQVMFGYPGFEYSNTTLAGFQLTQQKLERVLVAGFKVLLQYDSKDIYRCGIEEWEDVIFNTNVSKPCSLLIASHNVSRSFGPVVGYSYKSIYTDLYGSMVVIETKIDDRTVGLIVGVSAVGLLVLIMLIISIVVVIVKVATIRKRRKNAALFDKLIDEHGLELNEAWRIQFEDIKNLSEIGAGASATVFRGKWKGRDVAVKLFPMNIISPQGADLQQFHTELNTLTTVRDKNIVHFYGATFSMKHFGIVTEYCKNGTLKNYVQANAGNLTWERKMRLAREVADGLIYLHSLNMIHRDLKPENILVDDDHHAKITDFGLTRTIKNVSHATSFKVGTNVYIAPEMTLGKAYDARCDVFSFGIILYELLTENFNPYSFSAQSNFNIESVVAHNPNFRPRIPEKDWNSNEKGLIALMMKCWSHDANDRPFMDAVLASLQEISS